MSKTVTVTAHFYRAIRRDQRPWPAGGFDPSKALETIRDRPRAFDAPGNLFDKVTGVVTGQPPVLVVDNVTIGAAQRLYLPSGHIVPRRLDTAAATFVMFFPGNVVGMVQTTSGPKAGAVATYISMIAGDQPAVALDPILDRDQLKRFRSGGEIVDSLRVEGPPSAADDFADGSGLAEVFEVVRQRFGGANNVKLVIESTTATGRDDMSSSIRRELDELSDQAIDRLATLKAHSFTERKTADLLKDLVTAKVYVTLDRDGLVDPLVMAAKIEEAYGEARKRIPAP